MYACRLPKSYGQSGLNEKIASVKYVTFTGWIFTIVAIRLQQVICKFKSDKEKDYVCSIILGEQ